MFRWLRDLFLPRDLDFKMPAVEPLALPPETRVRVDGRIGTVTGFHTDDKTRARVIFTDPQRKSWLAQVSLHRISWIYE